MRTQVGIVGAGPAGLVLAHLLRREAIDCVLLEDRSREHVEQRVRAGVLEQGTVDTLIDLGVGERLQREGLVHHGVELRFGGVGHRISLSELTGGRTITLYGQQKVVEDLIDAWFDGGGELRFEVDDVRVDPQRARVEFTHDGERHDLDCDVVAGCDGFHGVCRPTIPDGVLTVYERVYPFAWLGILAEVAPSSDELIYCHHERGFALHSMRSPQLTRLYLQVEPDDDIDEWADERIWEELQTRFATAEGGWVLDQGPIVEKGITPMRSFVVEPMQHGRLFLAGDAAHIVPPTGAKGLNLAVHDVKALASALAEGSESALAAYSETCLRRVWRVQHFSWWMTSMLHRAPNPSTFEERLQKAQLDYVTSSEAGARTLAENYVGLERV